MWTISLYTTTGGRRPVAEFIKQLPAKLRAKVVHDIDLLAEFGTLLGEPRVSKLRGTATSIWELRSRRGSDQVRILFGTMEKAQIVLLNGFVKKSRATPLREIRTAERRMKSVLGEQP